MEVPVAAVEDAPAAPAWGGRDRSRHPDRGRQGGRRTLPLTRAPGRGIATGGAATPCYDEGGLTRRKGRIGRSSLGGSRFGVDDERRLDPHQPVPSFNLIERDGLGQGPGSY